MFSLSIYVTKKLLVKILRFLVTSFLSAVIFFFEAHERHNYRLLCMDGSRKSVEEYEKCNFAKEPARAVIARTDTDSQYVYDVLKQIPVCPYSVT